jgi:hypothetical protein
MAELVTLDEAKCADLQRGESWGRSLDMGPDEPEIRTMAGFLLPDEDDVDPYPWLDLDLRNLVCACLATEGPDRPELGALVSTVSRAVTERTEEWYAAREFPTSESDAAIQLILNELIFSA